MRFHVVIKVLSVIVVFILRLITRTEHESEMENTVANFTTQVCLGLLDIADEFRRRRLVAP